jgi:hypothetical protein
MKLYIFFVFFIFLKLWDINYVNFLIFAVRYCFQTIYWINSKIIRFNFLIQIRDQIILAAGSFGEKHFSNVYIITFYLIMRGIISFT